MRVLITGGEIEQLRDKRDGLWRYHAWSVGTAVPDIRLARDKNRYHGYPECSSQDHRNQTIANRTISVGKGFFRELKDFAKL